MTVARATTSPSPAPAPTRRATLPRDEVTDIDVDTTDPVDRSAGDPRPTAGWNNTDVTVAWTCTDALRGAPAPGSRRRRRCDQSYTRTCTDKAGNTTGEDTDVNIDKTAPSSAGRSPLPTTPAGTTGTSPSPGPAPTGLSGVTDAAARRSSARVPTSPSPAPAPTGRQHRQRRSQRRHRQDRPVDQPGAAAANTAGWNNGDVTVDLDLHRRPLGRRRRRRPRDPHRRGRRPERQPAPAPTGPATRPRDAVTDINIDQTEPDDQRSRRSPPPTTPAGTTATSPSPGPAPTTSPAGRPTPAATTVIGRAPTRPPPAPAPTGPATPPRDTVTDVDVDQTAPDHPWIGPIGDGAAFYFGSVPPVPTAPRRTRSPGSTAPAR